MEHLPCPKCGASNLKTDHQCLSCGEQLLKRSTPPVPPQPTVPLAPPEPYWETPQGQRRIAILSGIVLAIGLWILLGQIFGFMLIPILICAGIWELKEWYKDRKLDQEFAQAKDRAELQAVLARHDRPDRIVQTYHGNVHVQGFDSRLGSTENKSEK